MRESVLTKTSLRGMLVWALEAWRSVCDWSEDDLKFGGDPWKAPRLTHGYR